VYVLIMSFLVAQVTRIVSIIGHGRDPCDIGAYLIESCLSNIAGRLDFGVDSRIALDLSADIESCKELRAGVKRDQYVLQPRHDTSTPETSLSKKDAVSRNITLSWDRPYGSRAVIMVCVNLWNLRVIVDPELFRDLGNLCRPGYPYLSSSASPPVLAFNGRFVIFTLSSMEVWMLAGEHANDTRSIVISFDAIAKVNWAVMTGRIVVELSGKDLRVELSHYDAFNGVRVAEYESFDSAGFDRSNYIAVPLLYPTSVSVKYEAGGYDPPSDPGGEPVYQSGSTVNVDAESLLARVDVNDAPVLLAVGSSFRQLGPSCVADRAPQPGRFDEWIDRGSGDGDDAKFALDFSLPNVRLLFSDESGGRHIPIMEARGRNVRGHCNSPWVTIARIDVSIDLFNEEKAWWEPGIERLSVHATASQGRSGSTAISIRAAESIEINVTPSSVSGAMRVGKALKHAVEGLDRSISNRSFSSHSRLEEGIGLRPSVAAFCVQNHTGRPAVVWHPHDSSRRSLRGDGAEVEMDVPSDDALWHQLSAGRHPEDIAADANQSRHSTLRCLVAIAGYEVVELSTAEVGTKCLQLMPEVNRTVDDADRWALRPFHVVWDVSMRDGIPIGCIRSVFRIVNDTRTVLEVGVGRPLAKSQSSSSSCAMSTSSPLLSHQLIDTSSSPGMTTVVLEANGIWCIR
jgi:hypothetical protein